MANWKLEEWANDKNTLVVVCTVCGARGAVMSRNWNYDESAGVWEPQPRHVPDCGHLDDWKQAAKQAR